MKPHKAKFTTRDIRIFLGIWAGIFALFLAFGFFRHGIVREWALIGLCASTALMAVPRLATPIYKAWLGFGDIMGFVISRTILAVIFFGIFTPLGIFFRLTKRDALNLKRAFKTSEKSFFTARKTQPTSMKNQF